jgi:hypothetical protein
MAFKKANRVVCSKARACYEMFGLGESAILFHLQPRYATIKLDASTTRCLLCANGLRHSLH